MIWFSLLITITFLFNIRLGTALLWGAIAKTLMEEGGNYKYKLLKCIVYSAPFYYFSFFGTNDRMSACTVLCLAFGIILAFERIKHDTRVTRKSLYFLFAWLVFMLAYISSVFQAINPMETLLESYQIVILVFVILSVCIYNRKFGSDEELESLLELYVQGTIVLAIGVFVQYALYNMTGTETGFIFKYGDRAIYNLFFYAKSVLSFYLSIGLLYFYIEFFKKKSFMAIGRMVILLGAILINNSRTGLVCMLIVALIYTIFHFKDAITSLKVMVALLLFLITVIYIFQYMLSIRSGLASIIDDNGRSDLIIKAIQLLPNYVFSGIGGSGLDYTQSSLGMVIHNFAIAYLIQFGCIGGMAVNYMLFSCLWNFKSDWIYFVLITLLGGMMFANWQNCVFVFPIFILCILKSIPKGGRTWGN